mgnify:CR=1 FL=1
MSNEQKYELQKFVFPKGATYKKENDRVRTPETQLIIWENQKTHRVL